MTEPNFTRKCIEAIIILRIGYGLFGRIAGGSLVELVGRRSFTTGNCFDLKLTADDESRLRLADEAAASTEAAESPTKDQHGDCLKDALKSKLKAICSEEIYDCITILKSPRRDSGLLEPRVGHVAADRAALKWKLQFATARSSGAFCL